jgi:hypothetical protein
MGARSLIYLIITETQPYEACGRNDGCGARKQGHAVNTSLYARRQPGPGQSLDRFPVSPSPCCRRSLFADPTPAANVGGGSGPGLQDRLPQGRCTGMCECRVRQEAGSDRCTGMCECRVRQEAGSDRCTGMCECRVRQEARSGCGSRAYREVSTACLAARGRMPRFSIVAEFQR